MFPKPNRAHGVRSFLSLAVAGALLAAASLHAQNWSGVSDTSFSNAANWDTLPANDGTASLHFGNSATGYTVVFDSNWSVAGLDLITSGTGYQFNGSGSPTITVGSGGITDNGTKSLNSNGGFTMALPSAITYYVASATDFANWSFSGSGDITKTGSGTLAMGSGSGNNLSWTGHLIVNAGTVSINNDNKLGAVPGTATPGAITLAGGTLSMSGTATINANRGIAVTAASSLSGSGSNTITYNGVITGSANLTVKSGTFSLSGANTYSGNFTLGNSGILKISNATTLQNATLVASSGNLTFGVTAATLGALSGSRSISLIDSTLPVTLTVGRNNASTTYSGVLSSSGSLIKTGTGTFTLSGNNTYTGTTTVNGGTLAINGTPTGTGAFTVNSGGTLAGTGSVGGLTTVASGGALSAGTSGAGTLTFTHGLTLNTGSVLDFDLGLTNNEIRVSGGTVTGSGSVGGILVDLADSGGFQAGTYTLLDYTGSSLSNLDATGLAIGTGIAGYNYSFVDTGSQLQLIATAVPEPGTCALLAGAATLALAVIRRRRAAVQS